MIFVDLPWIEMDSQVVPFPSDLVSLAETPNTNGNGSLRILIPGMKGMSRSQKSVLERIIIVYFHRVFLVPKVYF